MNLAIVHDALVNLGGAERVVATLHEIFPDAPIYTTAYLPARTHAALRGADIRTSFLQPFVRSEAQLKLLFPLTIAAVRRFDLSSYDLVLSSSTFCAKDVSVPDPARHVCYCYAYFRPVWEFDSYIARFAWNGWKKAAARHFFSAFRGWDFRAGQKPGRLIAISQESARKIERAYHRTPSIIYPPVDVARYPLSHRSENFFLAVSRLMPYKRLDIVVEAFRELRYPLKVVGTGPDLARLWALAGPETEFTGAVPEDRLIDLYSRCRCLMFPGEEDFGLVPLEAHACGKPVIAFGRGGALETLIPANPASSESGVGALLAAPAFAAPPSAPTAVFFYEQTPAAVVAAVRQFERLDFSPAAARAQAMRFDTSRFRRELLAFLDLAARGAPLSARASAVAD
jgi:glycosyltransferase involved in cell wall biosynthesis